MRTPVTVVAEGEQPFGCDEFLAAEADSLDVMHLDRDALAAAFAAPACSGTHLLA